MSEQQQRELIRTTLETFNSANRMQLENAVVNLATALSKPVGGTVMGAQVVYDLSKILIFADEFSRIPEDDLVARNNKVGEILESSFDVFSNVTGILALFPGFAFMNGISATFTAASFVLGEGMRIIQERGELFARAQAMVDLELWGSVRHEDDKYWNLAITLRMAGMSIDDASEVANAVGDFDIAMNSVTPIRTEPIIEPPLPWYERAGLWILDSFNVIVDFWGDVFAEVGEFWKEVGIGIGERVTEAWNQFWIDIAQGLYTIHVAREVFKYLIMSLAEEVFEALFAFSEDHVPNRHAWDVFFLSYANSISGDFEKTGAFENGITQDNISEVEKLLASLEIMNHANSPVWESWYNFWENGGKQLYEERFQGKEFVMRVGSQSDDVIHGGDSNALIIALGGDNVIHAGGGSNIIYVDNGNNTIYGGTGSDVIRAGNGSNRIELNHGNNDVRLGNGNNTILGGSGDDSIHVGDGDNTINTVSGDNWISAGHGNNTITGGTGNDGMNLGDGDNIVNLTAGENWMWAGHGNNVIHGGSGNDNINAGDGQNRIYGVAGDNWISVGHGGGNVIIGGTGNDHIFGGDGDDRIEGVAGDNKLYAGNGNNTILGGTGNDHIYGGSGNDYIDAGGGTENWIFTANGNNTVFGSHTGNDHIYAGDNNDTIDARGGNNRIYTANGDNIVRFGDGNNVITLGAGSNRLYGGSGDNIVFGGGGGNNHFDLGTGNNQIQGGHGNNTYVYRAGQNLSIVDSTGNNTIVLDGINASDVNTALINGRDLLMSFGGTSGGLVLQKFMDGTDFRRFNLVFADGTEMHITEKADNWLNPGSGGGTDPGGGNEDDCPIGNTDPGGGENDDCPGNGDNSGGNDSDGYVFNLGNGNITIVANADMDVLTFGAGITADGIQAYRTNWNDLTITFTGANDVLVIQGFFSSAANRNFGVEFADGSNFGATDSANPLRTLNVSANENQIFAPDDTGWALRGHSGDTTLNGGGGNDVLYGGSGNSWLNGGNGNTTYVFSSGNTVINDWSNGNNTVVLKGVTAGDVVISNVNGSDLVVDIAGTGDKLTINGFRWTGASYTFEFADGSIGVVDKFTWELEMQSQVLGVMFDAFADFGAEVAVTSSAIPEHTITQTLLLVDAMSAFSTESNICWANQNNMGDIDTSAMNQLLVNIA